MANWGNWAEGRQRAWGALGLIGLVSCCCVVMALVETVLEPAYAVKSAIKVVVFGVVPFGLARIMGIRLWDRGLRLTRREAVRLLALGAAIYGVIIGGWWLTGHFVDYNGLVGALAADQQVDSESFWGVALYISLGNSFLEEFLFRLVAFIKLAEYAGRRVAYAFSSVGFAVYHIAMLGAAFPLPLLALAVAGLAAGGIIFDYVDEKSGNIYNSWMIHMFADLALMTLWRFYI